MSETEVTLEQARAVRTWVVQRYAGLPQVVGVGLVCVGEGFGVKVNLKEPLPQTEVIPSEIQGVSVQTEVVGTIRTQAS